MLYIVATPIGNLEDLSLRAAKTLASSDIILAEDTRSAHILLDHIKKSYMLPVTCSVIISFYKDCEFEKLPQVINWLNEGKNISLISESGMPLISDPGYFLVATCIKKGMQFTVIPGPTAITTSLVYSGFNPENFMFMGFLPKKESQVFRYIDILKSIKKINPKTVFIFYESPKRINKTLEIIEKLIPEAKICICREMTKKFEEIIRGKAPDLLNRTYKGEIVLLVKL